MRLVFNSQVSVQVRNAKLVRITDLKAIVNGHITKEEMGYVTEEKCILLKCKVHMDNVVIEGSVLIKRLAVGENEVEIQVKLMSDNVKIPYHSIEE